MRRARFEQNYVEVNSEEEDFTADISALGDGDHSYVEDEESSHHNLGNVYEYQRRLPSMETARHQQQGPISGSSESFRNPTNFIQQYSQVTDLSGGTGRYLSQTAGVPRQVQMELSQRIHPPAATRQPHYQMNQEQRLAQALQDSQLHSQEKDDKIRWLESELAKSKIEGSNLKKAVSQANKKGPKTEASMKEDDKKTSPLEKRIGEAARKYLMLDEMFLEGECFLQENPRVEVYVAKRYESYQSKIDAATTEMYMRVPSDLHRHVVKDPAFKSTFTDAFNGHRRSLVLRIRAELGHRIWGGNAADYSAGAFKKRGKDPVFLTRVYHPEKNGQFTKKAPLFYPNEEYDNDEMFKTRELAMLLRGLLFGTSAVDNPESTPPATSTGRKYGIKTLTPGLIAMNAVLALYANSGDEHLLPKGKQTGILYQSLFNSLKNILIIKNTDKKEVMDDLLRFYLPIVFAGLKTTQGIAAQGITPADDEELSSGIEDCIGTSRQQQKAKGKEKYVHPHATGEGDHRIHGQIGHPGNNVFGLGKAGPSSQSQFPVGQRRAAGVRFSEPETTDSPVVGYNIMNGGITSTNHVVAGSGARPGILKQTVAQANVRQINNELPGSKSAPHTVTNTQKQQCIPPVNEALSNNELDPDTQPIKKTGKTNVRSPETTEKNQVPTEERHSAAEEVADSEPVTQKKGSAQVKAPRKAANKVARSPKKTRASKKDMPPKEDEEHKLIQKPVGQNSHGGNQGTQGSSTGKGARGKARGSKAKVVDKAKEDEGLGPESEDE